MKWKWYLALWTVGPYDPWPWSYVRLFKLLKVATSFHPTKQIWYEVRSNSRYIARWTLMPREILFYCFAHHFVNFTLILIFVLHMWHWLLPYIRPKHMKAIHQVYLEITMLGCWPLSMRMRNIRSFDNYSAAAPSFQQHFVSLLDGDRVMNLSQGQILDPGFPFVGWGC